MQTPTPNYDIREARTGAERAGAYRLRYELYVEGQGLFTDLADHERRFLIEPNDNQASIWIAEHEGRVVATGRMCWGDTGYFDPEMRAAFEVSAFADIVREHELAVASRMLVAPAHRGRGLAVEVIRQMFATASSRGCQLIVAECEPHLVNKWLGLGLRSYGLREHPTNGTLVRMAFVTGDREQAHRRKSPLRAHAEVWTAPSERSRCLGERLDQSQRFTSERADRRAFWTQVERVTTKASLARFFGGISDDELGALLRGAHMLDCDEGARLIREAHVSCTLYLLLSGSLLVCDEDRTVAEIDNAGAIVGEVALFSDAPRLADVVVGSGGAWVLALSERSLRAMLDEGGPGAVKFLMSLTRGLCGKLRERAAHDGVQRRRGASETPSRASVAA